MLNQTGTISVPQHVELFMAYISRLTMADAECILDTLRAYWFAGQNLSNSSQLAAHNDMATVIRNVLDRMLDHDRQNIAAAIERSIGRATTQTVPPAVLSAVERMSSPLHESWLSGVTAQEDARCMKIIKEFVEGLNTTPSTT